MGKPYNFDSPSTTLQSLYKPRSLQDGGYIPVFSGATRQRGYGLGGAFTRLFRSFAPTLKNVAKTAGKQLLKTGAKIASDLIDGQKLSDSASRNLSSGGRNLFREITADISSGRRGGAKRKRQSSKQQTYKRSRKAKGRDIFS